MQIKISYSNIMHTSTCICVCVSVYFFVRTSVYYLSLSLYLSISFSVCLCLSVCLSVSLSLHSSHKYTYTHSHTHTHSQSHRLSKTTLRPLARPSPSWKASILPIPTFSLPPALSKVTSGSLTLPPPPAKECRKRLQHCRFEEKKR